MYKKLTEHLIISTQKDLLQLTVYESCQRLMINNSQGSQEKKIVTYKGHPIRLSSDFLAGTLQDRREWNDIVKILKGMIYSKY